VYLNGEYWGPYNFQERHSDNQTEYKYGVDKDNVISYDNGELDDGNPGEEPNFDQMITMASSNYSAFCDIFDIDNFIDYWAAEIYIYNEDWPHNNYRMWRTRTKETGNPYGDTKWRYQMFDTEFALGIYNGGGLTGQSGTDAFNEILNGDDKGHNNNRLFMALLKNSEFCKKFVNTMMDLYNVNFHPDNYGPKLNSYAAVYRPLMTGYFSRWSGWDGTFDNKVNDARNYLSSIRNAMVNTYLPTYFGGYSGIANIGVTSANLRDVTLSVTGVSGATIKINSVTPNLASGSWVCKYYSAIPITVTASPAPSGYEFVDWTVTGGTPASSTAQTITVTLTGNAQITAKYKQTGSSVVPVTGVNLNRSALSLKIGETGTLSATVNPSNATYKTVIWSSSNSGIASVNNGKVTAISGGTATITASTVDGTSATCTVTVKSPVVFLDLAEILKTQSQGVINNLGAFNSMFGGKILPGGEVGTDARYEIIVDGGVKKLQYIDYEGRFPGLDLRDDKIDFHVGDVIEIKGRLEKIDPKCSGFILQLDTRNWTQLQGWWANPGVLERTFTLTNEDVNGGENRTDWEGIPYKANIKGNNPPGIRLRVCSDDDMPWTKRYEGGVGKVVIEQIKVWGYRD